MKNIAVITSGGDAPGINSVFSGMLNTARNVKIWGYNGGFDGILSNMPKLINNLHTEEFVTDSKLLFQTARSKTPQMKNGIEKIVNKLKKDKMDALVVCGGDGSSKAAKLIDDFGFPVMVIPMTIDNDIDGIDYTIGHDSVINKIKDIINDLHKTAHNMPNRIFMVEVFGGNHGSIALSSAIASGSNMVFLPEYKLNLDKICDEIQKQITQKEYLIIICSEGAYLSDEYSSGNQGISFEIGKLISEKINERIRYSILGYFQRGGSPSSYDSIIGTKSGNLAIDSLLSGKHGYMIGIKNSDLSLIKLDKINLKKKELVKDLVLIAKNKKILV